MSIEEKIKTAKEDSWLKDSVSEKEFKEIKDNERRIMTDKELFTKRKCNNPKFEVIVCCQGQPFYYQYHTLIGALFGYAKNYLKKKKYGTMNFSLKQVF